jgi:hypothetical protein
VVSPPKRKNPKQPNYVSDRPSRKQILVQYHSNTPKIDADAIIRESNTGFARNNLKCKVVSCHPAYKGYSFSTTIVPNQDKIAIVRAKACAYSPPDQTPWVGLPLSKSFLKVMDILYYKDLATKALTKVKEVVAAM